MVTNHFTTNMDTWMEDNAHYDPLYKKKPCKQDAQSPVTITYSDSVRKEYIHQLNYKPGDKCDGVGSRISKATGQPIGTATLGGSRVNKDGSANKVFRTKVLALELAESKKENAELKAKLSNMDHKLELLTKALLGQKLPDTNPAIQAK